MRILYLAIFLLFIQIPVYGIPVDPYKPIKVQNESHIHITYGSCFKFYGHERGDIFGTMDKHNTDLFVWLGDAAYADKWLAPLVRIYPGKEHCKMKFDMTKNDPFYSAYTNKTQIVGVWDDHDYGTGNGDKYHPYKDEIKEVYFDFIDEPENSPRRREGDGIYGSYYIGENKRVKLILLDLRYELDSLGGEDMLGEKQWQWLENEFRTSKADFVLIGSSTQFLPDDHPITEKWYEWSREKFFKLIRDYQVNGVVILSGDVHMGMLMQHPCSKKKVGYPFYELTSSGMTHTANDLFPLMGELKDEVYPPTYNAGAPKFVGNNYATIDIEFNGEEATMVLRLRDENGTVVIEKAIKNTELRSNGEFSDEPCITDAEGPFMRVFLHYVRMAKQGRYWAIIALILVALLGVLMMFVLYLITLVLRSLMRIAILMKEEFKKTGTTPSSSQPKQAESKGPTKTTHDKKKVKRE